MYLCDAGRSSVGSQYELSLDGKLFAEGTAKIVWIDAASRRSIPLPDAIVTPLRALEAGHAAAAPRK